MLARHLSKYRDRDDAVVLGLPRGGVPVEFEVAEALRVPLDVLVVRKLGVPGHEEVAFGAIASGGLRVLDDEVVRAARVTPEQLASVTERESAELRRRAECYRGDRPPLDVAGKTVIVVDDGLATGSTMRAAVLSLRQAGLAAVVVAVPVAPESTCRRLARLVDEVVCAAQPDPFVAVGAAYRDFTQTDDAEVQRLLARR